jgi:ABC-2 type transport system permease protein
MSDQYGPLAAKLQGWSPNGRGPLRFLTLRPILTPMKAKHDNNEPSPSTSRMASAGDELPVIRPIQIDQINWIGLQTLYLREVQRFMKVALQTLAAPVITSILFLMVFSVAIGNRAGLSGGVDFVTFLIPGLVMMTVLQNAFANTSSSIVVSKVQGNIVDLLMPPLGPGELLVGLAAGGMTRGIMVGIVAAASLGILGGVGLPSQPLVALAFLFLGSLLMSLAGILAGIKANKFDEMAAITNFVIQPLAFLSGTFYSVNRLPAPFDTIATLNPVFYVIDGFRYGMIGVSDRSILIGLAGLAVLNLVLGYVCYRVLCSGWRLKS